MRSYEKILQKYQMPMIFTTSKKCRHKSFDGVNQYDRLSKQALHLSFLNMNCNTLVNS